MSNQTDHAEYRRVADVLERDAQAVRTYAGIVHQVERGLHRVASTQVSTEARGAASKLISLLQTLEEQYTEDVEYNREKAKSA